MMKATVQGLSEDLRIATGDFGSIDLGEISEARLKKILEQVSKLSTPPEVDGKQQCPPGLHIETHGDIVSFTMDGGKIFCANAESEVGLEEAVAMATGKLSTRKKAAAAREGTEKPPVRMKHIPPTDQTNLSPSDIDTGSNSPQIATRVWKSGGWRGMIFVGPVMAAFIFLGAFAFTLEKVWGAAVGAVILGIAFCLLPFLASRVGHTQFRLGFAWETNTLWTQHGKQKLRFYPDANRTVDFFVQKLKIRPGSLGHVSFSGGDPRYRSTGSRVVWNLMIRRSGSVDWDVAALTTQHEANEACAKAKDLLSRQG